VEAVQDGGVFVDVAEVVVDGGASGDVANVDLKATGNYWPVSAQVPVEVRQQVTEVDTLCLSVV
jgi:hypothetical protein